MGLRGFSRPRCTNGWEDGMGVGNYGLGTRLSKMWGKLRKYPHRFEAVLSVQGYHGHFACRDFRRRWEFSRALQFWNSKVQVEMEGVVGEQLSRPICDPIQKELEGPTKDRPAY